MPISLEVRRWAVRDFLGTSRSGCTVSESVQVDRSTTHILNFRLRAFRCVVHRHGRLEPLWLQELFPGRHCLALRALVWAGSLASRQPFLGCRTNVLLQQALTRACCAIAKSMLRVLRRRRCFEHVHFRIRGCGRLALRHENSRIWWPGWCVSRRRFRASRIHALHRRR